MKEFSLSLSVLTSKHEREIDNLFEALNGLIDLFDVLAGVQDNYLIWGSNTQREATISICPKGISQFLRYSLFNGKTSVILTSATMCQTGETLEEQYAYLTQSLGYKGDYMERQASPFDYDNHTMLYISKDIPYYNHQNKVGYLEAAYKEMLRLCNLTDGRTLVLFQRRKI